MRDNAPMRPIAWSRRRQFQDYVDPLERLGYNPHRILERGGISKWLRGAPDEWVPVHCVETTINLAAKVNGEVSTVFGSRTNPDRKPSDSWKVRGSVRYPL